MQNGLLGVLAKVAGLINLATPIVVALALLYFFWGLANYVLKAGGEDGAKKNREIMIWGILALFVMVSVWGIVNVVKDTFGLNNTSIQVPGINVPNQTQGPGGSTSN
jgi:predicted PurR-regulated permease PerM